VQQRRKFQILQTLGKGGFGTVYRAEMTDAGGFSKQVALKIMSYEGDEAEGIARRMRDEARMLGLIRHRAVVGVNSLIPLQDGWGVVMEYIDGVDLSACIKAGPIKIGAVLEIIEEVAGALDAAYTAKVPGRKDELKLVHRDIKPSNIRVTRQGEVKLLDFGVARAEFDTKESQDSSEFVMGSTRYMSPERRRGWETHQGDVYALGLVLANALTRKRFPEPPEAESDHARFLGTVLETVNRSLSSNADEAVRGAAGQVKFLLLEMLAFEPMDRPNAGTVERRIRKIRKALPTPWLREWSEMGVRRVQESSAVPDDIRGDTGKVLIERAGGGAIEPPTQPITPYGNEPDDSSSIRRPHGTGSPGTAVAPAPASQGMARGTVAALMAGSFALGAIVGALALMSLGG
jgi:serine/threonine protein kinase